MKMSGRKTKMNKKEDQDKKVTNEKVNSNIE